SVSFTLALAGIYLLVWYLPNREFYNLVMLRETDARYPSTLVHLLGQSRFNFTELLFVPYLKPLLVSGGLAIVTGLLWFAIQPSAWRTPDRLLFLGSLLWLLLELHKVPMTYMPHRYMVPAYAALAVVIAAVCQVAWNHRKSSAIVAVVFAAFLGAWQLCHNHQAWQRRTCELQEVNDYLRQYDWHGETITGTWAASVAWQTKAKVIPVWHGFLNDDKVSGSRMMVMESDQDDSRGGLISDGAASTVQADSVRRFPLWRYKVDLYWLNPGSSR
ncbi:MAG: hypothetical protein R6V49_04860, partial [Bacteroidales bacterium]